MVFCFVLFFVKTYVLFPFKHRSSIGVYIGYMLIVPVQVRQTERAIRYSDVFFVFFYVSCDHGYIIFYGRASRNEMLCEFVLRLQQGGGAD